MNYRQYKRILLEVVYLAIMNMYGHISYYDFCKHLKRRRHLVNILKRNNCLKYKHRFDKSYKFEVEK